MMSYIVRIKMTSKGVPRSGCLAVGASQWVPRRGASQWVPRRGASHGYLAGGASHGIPCSYYNMAGKNVLVSFGV